MVSKEELKKLMKVDPAYAQFDDVEGSKFVDNGIGLIINGVEFTSEEDTPKDE